jgi:hypothetical protein
MSADKSRWSSDWRFSRAKSPSGFFSRNRLSTDAIGALSQWAATDPRRSFTIIEGGEDEPTVVATLTTVTDDTVAGSQLDTLCEQVGVDREYVADR